MKGLLISGSKSGWQVWKDLSGKVLHNKTIVLQDLGDIHTFTPGVVCKCDTLIVDRCDKNLVYYWLTNPFRELKSTFPDLKTIYLGSHPCEPTTLQRLHLSSTTTTYLREDWYSIYNRRWLGNDFISNPGKGVVMITRENYEKLLSNLDLTEEMVISKQ
jgi:hypothetical protein